MRIAPCDRHGSGHDSVLLTATDDFQKDQCACFISPLGATGELRLSLDNSNSNSYLDS